jgi:hypothetical protein
MKKKIFIFLLVLGVLSRIFLAVRLPIWHDEYYSIWASQHTFHEITHSIPDVVHPPGYYLILYFWGKISTHLYWFRLLTIIAFIFNIFLMKKLAEKIGTPKNPLLLVSIYIFSGYFIIFDWQVRMYTLIDTLILSSILVLNGINDKGNKGDWGDWGDKNYRKYVRGLVGFTLISFLGLYIDYAFIWYFVPAAVFSLIYLLIKKDRRFFYLVYSYITSCLLFVLAIPTIFKTSMGGIHGIEWMGRFLDPGFYVPFFLGSHTTLFFTFIFSILFLAGLINLIRYRLFFPTSSAIIFSALVSINVTLIYTYFFTPLFHVRSLQIVGLMILIFFYYALIKLPNKIKTYAVPIIILLFVTNFVLVNKTLIYSPGKVIIDFFPWRDILNSSDLKNVSEVRYKINDPLPTQMLLKGLEYTLLGNENIGMSPIKLSEYNDEVDNVGCEKFYNEIMELYKCKNEN